MHDLRQQLHIPANPHSFMHVFSRLEKNKVLSEKRFLSILQFFHTKARIGMQVDVDLKVSLSDCQLKLKAKNWADLNHISALLFSIMFGV